MPDTDKREEGEEPPQESADMNMAAPGKEETDAPAAESHAPAGGNAENNPSAHAPELTAGSDLGEFADNVVSGLEAALSGHGSEATGLQTEDAGLDLEQMTEAYFTGWGSPEEVEFRDDAEKADAGPIDLQAVSLASLAASKGWELSAREVEPELEEDEFTGTDPLSPFPSEGEEEPESLELPDSGGLAGDEPLSLHSDAGLASWGASGVGQEEPALEFEPESHSLATRGEAGLARAASLSGFPDSSGDLLKHDELANAVQSALMSIYGGQTLKPAGPAAQRRPAVAQDDPSSLAWNKSPAPESGSLSPQEVILNYFDYTPEDEQAKAAEPVVAAPADGRLTPQEVILNYFDYQDAPAGEAPQPAGYGVPKGRAEEEPITLTPQAEPAVPFRRARPEGERPIERPEWVERAAQVPQYSGPASFPVPAAGPGAEHKPQAAPAQESSRLLGAAAIGLMGGIAIAASLAAFLIYGPHPSSVEIPGFGNIRIDKDEQGYGPALAEEGAKEPGRSQIARPAEYSGEILAADAVAIPGQPSPLSIGVRSQLPSEKMLVSIAGVPEGGRLSAGVDAGGGNWLVPPRRLAGLAINLPAGSPSVVSLEAQLLDSNTRAPVSPKGTFAVRLASAAAEAGQAAPAFAPSKDYQPSPGTGFNAQTVPAPQAAAEAAASAQQPAPDASFRTQTVTAVPPQKGAVSPFTAAPVQQAAPPAQVNTARRTSPRPEVEDLIREGNKHMREGDILEARQFYQKAVAYGDPEAALAMGRSYDPIYFARIEKKNAEPDAAKAFDWYKRAMDAGAAQTAMVRIENLRHFLNE